MQVGARFVHSIATRLPACERSQTIGMLAIRRSPRRGARAVLGEE
jgi:hypothetical protein